MARQVVTGGVRQAPVVRSAGPGEGKTPCHEDSVMNLVNLTQPVRDLMASEVEKDTASKDGVYPGERLTDGGQCDYPGLLLEAVRNHDPAWLAEELRRPGRIKSSEDYYRSGKWHTRKVPVTAADTLAEGEFNRYYCRGV